MTITKTHENGGTFVSTLIVQPKFIFTQVGGAGVRTFDTGDPTTANTITSFTPAGNFGVATRARDPRQAQFGIKLIF